MVIPSFPPAWFCPALPLPGAGARVSVCPWAEPACPHTASLPMAPSGVAKWGNVPADVTAPFPHPKDHSASLFIFSTVPSPRTRP